MDVRASTASARGPAREREPVPRRGAATPALALLPGLLAPFSAGTDAAAQDVDGVWNVRWAQAVRVNADGTL